MQEPGDASDLLLAFYGDDFTGSTDVMEALQCAGVDTVLFVGRPSAELIARFPNARSAGMAGTSRTMSPDEMESALPDAFRSLAGLRPALVHYKICSTLDSSPTIGSIGRAIDIGQQEIGSSCVPVMVGAPILGRYCAFGNLFARSGLDTAPYRLDRHPTMRRHPTTPMDEADVRLHLAQQTDRPIVLIDASILDRGVQATEETLAKIISETNAQQGVAQRPVVLFDTMTDSHLPIIGRAIWNLAKGRPPAFVVGSSGVEYALAAYWRESGLLGAAPPVASVAPRDRIAVVSGSCSPVTDRQIGWAVENGFAEIPLDTPALAREASRDAAMSAALDAASKQLEAGHSVMLHTSRGPDDPRIEQTRRALALGDDTAEILGHAVGRLLRSLVERHDLPRVATTGGDTSGFAAREMKIDALQFIGPLAPGSPLCRAHSQDPMLDGREIAFKGGQVGRTEFFGLLTHGNKPHH